MPALLCGALWASLVGYLLSRALRQFRAHRATVLVPASQVSPPPALPIPTGSIPTVSIIVPARNEIDNIAACLARLTRQAGLAPRSSIIVVDDGSEDGTAAAVERQIERGGPITLVAAGPLPDGWVGKPHACWQGAMLAEAPWLCFIDADVSPNPRLLATAVAAAEVLQIDMLSLHPFQQLGSFWERLVIPAGLLIIACAKEVDTANGSADANGQFILIKRDVYFRVGGHAAVGSEICEDRALAVRVERAGYRFRVLAAEHLATTRMYRDLSSLWEGLSKNAIEILGSSAATMTAAAIGMLVGWAALLLPIAIAAAILPHPSAAQLTGFGLTLAGSAIVLGVQFGTARHFRIPAVFGVLTPCGHTAAAVLACHSFLLRRGGGVTWKGRRYDFHRKPSERGC